MLSRLYISNYALIDELEIKFRGGLTVITGETGAGKSIIMGALALVLGERLDVHSIRQKDRKTIVEGTFDLSGYGLQSFFDSHDIDYFENECIIRREVGINARSRAFVNDTPVSLTTLRELVGNLIDIHSQYSNMLLSKKAFQLDVVDVLGGNLQIADKYRNEYRQYKAKDAELAVQKENLAKRNAERDYIAFQIKQFEDVDLRENEDVELEATLATLSNVGEIKETLWKVSNMLDGDGESAAVIDNLRTVRQSLDSVEDKIAEVSGFGDRIGSVLVELKDVAHSVARIENDLVADPERLQETEERLGVIYDLERKYNVDSVAALMKIQKEFQNELDALDTSAETIDKLEIEVAERLQTVKSIGKELSQRRHKAASEFAEKLVDMAKGLSLKNLRFEVDLAPTAPGERGCDDVEFQFSFNRSQELMPVRGAASGGEISRLMLCIKAIVANSMNLPTMIFDEIDTGISGDVASKVGNLMSLMGKRIQVLAITHLPQVAAFADNHLLVYKEDEDNATMTNVKSLSEEEHVHEIARMLSGKGVNQAAIDNARALIADKTNNLQDNTKSIR